MRDQDILAAEGPEPGQTWSSVGLSASSSSVIPATLAPPRSWLRGADELLIRLDHASVTDPHRGQLHDVAGGDVAIGGLEIDRHEIAKGILERAGTHELQRLEHAEA